VEIAVRGAEISLQGPFGAVNIGALLGMSRRRLPSASRFPLQTTQVARFFVRTYCEFDGELAKQAAGRSAYCNSRDARRGKTFAADATRLLGHTLHPASLKPRRVYLATAPTAVTRTRSGLVRATIFGRPTLQAARQMIRLYQRFAGELRKHKESASGALFTAAEARSAMKFIIEVVDFLGYTIDDAALHPIRTRPRVTPLAHGAMRGQVVQELKHNGDWVTTASLAATIAQRNGWKLTPPRERHFRQKLREALNALHGAGRIMRRFDPPLPIPTPAQQWRFRQR
jgi:hypothetical protein